MKTRVFLSLMLAGSVVYIPVDAEAAKKRKTLFEVLFKKTYTRKQKKKLRVQALRQQQKKITQPVVKKASKKSKPLPKVATSKNYTYRVAKLSPIILAAAPISSVALANTEANTENSDLQKNTVKVSSLTADILNAENMKLRAEKHIADAVSNFYEENQTYHWLDDNGNWNLRAKSVVNILSSAGDFGLRADDYKVDTSEVSAELTSKELSAEKISRELSLTTVILRYAMDAKFGTINPNLLSGYHDFPVHYAKSSDMLDEIMNSPLILHTMQSMHPSNAKFAFLKNELIKLRSEDDDSIILNRKAFIKPGQESADLPSIVMAIKKRGSLELREKHSEVLDQYYGYLDYSKSLVRLVKDYQKEVGLGADGIIGRNTISKIAGVSSEDKMDKLLLSMERLRWHPHQFGERHVFINQPEYRARYIENGAENLSMRIVVGKKSNQTNFFYDEIEHVTYNPYWGVPRSIIVNEFTPKSISNPAYLDQRGYELKTWGGKKLKSSNINWSEVGTKPNFSVRQKPGPKNALGKLKIMFPNKHAIYMHDTPAKGLFNKDYRAYSHGCIRLHDPQAMAAAVLGTNKRQVNSHINPGKNNTQKLKVKVPVYVSYFTAWPQEDGSVNYFADMYGRDVHLLKAFKATQRARQSNISS